jgi:hypothetical protein
MKILLLPLMFAAALSCGEPPVEWAVPYPITDRPAYGYPALEGVTHHDICRAAEETGWFSHHAQIVHHKGVFLAAWSSHPMGEDGPGQRVLCAISDNGSTWKPPFECLPPMDEARDPGESGRVATAIGWVIAEGKAYVIGEVDDRLGKRYRDRISYNPAESTPERPYIGRYGLGRVARAVERNGKLGQIFWLQAAPPAPRLQGQSFPGSDDARFRRVAGRIVRTLSEPERRPSWDFQHKTAWTRGEDGHLLCEPTIYRRRDGVFVRISRDRERPPSLRLYAAVSRDGGNSWTAAVRTEIPDSPSKSCSGSLADGGVFLIGNYVPESARGLRDPLVLSLSRDGRRFDRAAAVRSGSPTIRKDGSAKSRGFQYPSAVLARGALWVIYSIGKEDVAVTRIPLDALKSMEVK